MELSGLDSKKYQPILNFKRELGDLSYQYAMMKNTVNSNRQIDGYGELAVKRLTQIRKEFSEEEKREMVSLFQSGKSTRNLGEKFGCSKTTITKLLREQGVEVTRCKAQSKLNIETVIKMYNNNHSSEEIAKHFGVSSNTILDCLRNHGIKIKNKWDYVQK